MQIGLFYGSSTCYTEMVAEQIQDYFGKQHLTLHNVLDVPLSHLQAYHYLILGISTWDFGELQEHWESVWSQWVNINFQGKKIALYGLGDQFGYSEWFLDAMGILYQTIQQQSHDTVQWCGFWPNQGYEFISSKALTPDTRQFVGLALDEVNQYDLTAERVQQWCQQIKQEFLLKD